MTCTVWVGKSPARVLRTPDDRGPAWVMLPAGVKPVRMDGTPMLDGAEEAGTIAAGDPESVRREYELIVAAGMMGAGPRKEQR